MRLNGRVIIYTIIICKYSLAKCAVPNIMKLLGTIRNDDMLNILIKILIIMTIKEKIKRLRKKGKYK